MSAAATPVTDVSVALARCPRRSAGLAAIGAVFALGFAGLGLGGCAGDDGLPGTTHDGLCWFRGKDKTGAPAYYQLKAALNVETCAVLLEIQRQKGALDSVRGSYHHIDIIVDEEDARAAIRPGFWAMLLPRGPDGRLVLPNEHRDQ